VEQKNRTLVEMARTMLYEHMTPTCFWADAISIACYISNRIFLRTILNLTPFGFALDASRMALISCLFGCKCFVLNRESLDKFESRSSDGILLVYTPHGRSYHVFNLETNTVVESCDVIFDETALCSCDVFECAGDKELEESIFVDEDLQGFDHDEDKPLLPSTSSLELIPASTLEVEASQATTSSTATVEASWIVGEIVSHSEGTSTSTDHR
jgi:hypothetical protein